MAKILEPVSPLEAAPVEFSALGRTHIMDQWRPSIETTVERATTAEKNKPAWSPPPLPPIPVEKEPEAWRKRSLKRCSLTSQMSMSNYSSEICSEVEPKHRTHVSVVSLNQSVKRSPSRNFSRPTTWREDGSRSVDQNWKTASYNPRNWSQAKKWLHTISAAATAFTCSLASSIVPHATISVGGSIEDLQIDAILPLALFAAGLAFGSPINSVCSEIVGRKVVLIVSLAAFAIVTLGSAFVTAYYPFVACRVVAAILASPALDASFMMLFEIWSSGTRQIPLGLYSLSLLISLNLGPAIGPYLLEFDDRSWLQYATLFAFVPTIVLLVSIRETHKTTLCRRGAYGSTFGRLTADRIRAIGRPLYLLCLRPQMLLCTLLASFNFATFFAIFAAGPGIFEKAYPNRFRSRGLNFVGMLVGVFIAFAGLIFCHLLTQHLNRSKLNRREFAQSEKERTAGSHVQMETRTSITPLRHIPSELSDPGLSRTVSRSSLSIHAPADTPNHDRDHKLKFGFATLAVMPADTLSNGPQNTQPLKMPAPIATSRSSIQTTDNQVWPLPPASPSMLRPARESQLRRTQRPSQRQEQASTQSHLCISLLGSTLSTGGIFIFAWTVDLQLAWIIPVVALGIFACGGTLVFVESTGFLLASGGSSDGEHAVSAYSTVRWVFAAAFSILSVPLFSALDARWAASVLGFINAGGTLMALLLLVLDRISKTASSPSYAA